MRKHLLGLVLIAGMVGCTSDSDVAPAGGVALPQSGPDLLPTATSLAVARGSAASFAPLPDRGELLAYGGVRKVRTSGAYTWHPVSLSEAHALNAIGSGRMVVSTPDGASLALEYQRHEEQADGNWTWIGRNEDGSSAVLTFGEKAVFGIIARGDNRYRVRTDRTGAWVVETDPRLVAANGGMPKDGNDTLLPPDGRALMASASRQLAKSTESDQGVEKAGGVIDLLIGYSSTIASELGSHNAAVTLMSNLAAMANNAYANSGVNTRLRLVHAMSVTYGDSTFNSEALKQLTGYDSDTQQPITPNAAFSDLRAARNQYGADLVAFVRRYREPEQDGCGIAWLLGGGGQSITAQDEAFGYAVVSDGEDVGSDNNTYFCSDYALAHELGHLMGQAHNREDALSAGVHSYAYGYREASPTGFFTIMAYPIRDSQQVEAPLFANPAVQYLGRPVGTATENNVLSMNQTMPIIATFRAAVVPVLGAARNDVDIDGRSDLLFHNPVTREFSYRIQNGPAVSRAYLVGGVGPGYNVVATGDFNGDGRVDLVWSHPANRDLYMWQGNGETFTSARFGDYPPGWAVVGAVDVNNDGRSDLLFHNASTREFSYRIMSGTTVVRAYLVGGVGAGYSVAATGDFNGDGFGDIVWTHPGNRDLYMWVGNGNTFNSSAFGSYPPGWVVSTAADVNGDGQSDLLFHNATTREFSYRIMNGLDVSRAYLVGNVGPGYTIATAGDFNGDGLGDVIWTNPNNFDLYMWIGNGNTFTSTPFGTYPSGWGIVR